ncbi:MAG: bifunctional precorrin-2 dehydrogenase/sirohydrochlorin ferrochelatase [Methanosphaera sp.]|nr:bifunctional precorrin-2 dehydrogenase/sirohydrochlorin ferrochelatase [Methanosphaera sp.]
MKDKNVLIIGTGSVGIRRARRFLKAQSKVNIVTKSIDEDIKDEFLEKGAHFYDNDQLDNLIDESDLIVVATDDIKLNEKIALKANDKLINCSSDPSISNVIFPSTFDIGGVTISVYTGSKSPLMAKTLRKKIQSIITDEDIYYIQLQEYVRELLKENVDSQQDRKEYMLKINEDERVREIIQNNDIDEAKRYVKEIIEKV